MSALRLIFASLAYHWRVQFAVAGGVVAGTAVITGALLVGDSMRGSLHDLTLQRLGRIDEALVADRLFRADLAGELAQQPAFGRHFADAVPAILLQTTLDTPERDPPILANRVNLIGCDKLFWGLFPKGRKKGISPISAGKWDLSPFSAPFPPGRWCSTSRWPGNWASARATR